MQDDDHIAHAVRCAKIRAKKEIAKDVSIKFFYLTAIIVTVYLCCRPLTNTNVARLIAVSEKIAKKKNGKTTASKIQAATGGRAQQRRLSDRPRAVHEPSLVA
ncbi:MAG: hypothetical protein NVSMB6_28160 [Burkholderiaceae bacterium]